MYGHTDYGLTTLLFSVPVTALHIWTRQDKWQPVKYNPGSLIINLGEALEIISGGHFKATRHKVGNIIWIARFQVAEHATQVTDTPKDQQHLERLSIVHFNASAGDLRLKPAVESPLLQREGFVEHQGVFREYKRLIDVPRIPNTLLLCWIR